MAPPPPASMPLKDRLLTVAQTLQFGWFMGHVTLLACMLRYFLSYIRFNWYGGVARFSYRISFIAAAATYGIVVYKGFRSRAKSGNKIPGGPIGLLGDENLQYLVMALVWLFSPQYALAVLPYAVYSIFHVLSYVRQTLIPTVQPPKVLAPAGTTSPNSKPQYAPNPTAERINNFVKLYYEQAMSAVASLEIFLWLRILLAAVLFQRRSWILLGIYTLFFRARFSQSAHARNSLAWFESRVDATVAMQGTPPIVRSAWDGIKGGARQLHAATDVNKYANGTAAPKKTS